MSVDVSWDDRADLYRTSEAHRRGPDLDLVVEWASGARRALDVATGGGHVARRLRKSGIEVVTCDSAPGMQPDVVCSAERLPFPDSSFDVVASRVAAHHYADVRSAAREMARVSADRVIVVDNLFLDDDAEEADRVRDPTHVRNLSEPEWHELLSANLRVEQSRRFKTPIEVEPWLERAGCSGPAAVRVRALLSTRIADGWIVFDRIAILARVQ